MEVAIEDIDEEGVRQENGGRDEFVGEDGDIVDDEMRLELVR